MRLPSRSGATIGVRALRDDGRLTLFAASLIAIGIVIALYLLPRPAHADTNPSFASRRTFGTGMDVSSATALGDLDNDGDLDLIVGNSLQQSVVYLNQGQGVFYNGPIDCARTRLMRCFGATSVVSPSVVIGDMNRDGALDIVVGGNGQQSAIYLNDPLNPGTFATGVLNCADLAHVRCFGAPSNTTSLAAGDLDNDGDLDLTVGNSLQRSVVYRNDGAGNLAPISLVPPAPFPIPNTQSVGLGDLDGDGYLDLVTGNYAQASVVYFNNGSGGASSFLTIPAANTRSVALGDVDSDGDLDLVIGNDGQPSAVIFNDGTGNAAGVLTLPITFRTRSLAMGDVNSDGAIDLVAGNLGTDPNIALLNDGRGYAYAQPSFGSNGQSVALGDVDGDGDLDLVMGTTGQNAIYINNGVGGVTKTWPENDPKSGAYTRLFGNESDTAASVAAGDMDGDGALDLVVGNNGQPSAVYLNDLSGNFPISRTLGAAADQTTGVAVGDLNNDGALDIVAANYGQPSAVYLNDLSGNFPISRTLGAAADQTTSVAVGDLNNDGALDIVVGNSGQASAVYLNDLSGNFATARRFGPAPGDAASVALGDLDGDRDLDIVLGSLGQNMIYLNDGAGNFASGAVDCAAPPPGARCFGPSNADARSVALGDFNGDGRQDIVAGSNVYLNDGRGNFFIGRVACGITQEVDCLDAPVAGLAVGDMNGDGRPDIVVGNAVQNVFYLNDGTGHFFGGPISCGFIANTHCFSPGADGTTSVAVADLDGDGDLDIAAGNGEQPGKRNAVYLNGLVAPSRLPDRPPSVVIARPGQTSDAPLFSAPEILAAPVIPISYTLFDAEGAPARAISATYSLDGGGTWHSAVAASGTVTANLDTRVPESYSSANVLPIDIPDAGTVEAPLFVPTALDVADVDVWLNIEHADDAQLTISLVAPSLATVDLVQGVSGANLTDTTLDDEASTPIGAGAAPFTGRFRPAGSLAALDGQPAYGIWKLRVVDGQSGAAGRIISWGIRLRTPQADAGVHVYNWDVLNSNLFGQSDDVVFRIAAYPTTTTTVGNEFQRPFLAAQSFPFRVRGNQVRVLSDTVPVSNALVFHLPAGQSGRAQAYADQTGRPFRTDGQGYLQGGGTLAISDSLVALYPISSTDTYTVYLTSAQPISTGLATYVVRKTGVQTLTVSSEHPLIVFNLNVSLEWDARADNDREFMERLRFDLQRSAEFLYDWTDGQVTLGRIRIYNNRARWDDAHIRIYATNRMRPIAAQGGIVTGLISDTQVPTNTYEPGQVHMGAIWNRFGQIGGNLGEDWPRTLAHEIGHFALYLNDNYLGLDAGGHLIPVEGCPSAMSDPYRDDYTEFHPDANWSEECGDTLSNQTTGRSDWSTIATYYGWLHKPAAAAAINPGPSNLPLAVTDISVVDPVTPTTTLPVPIFYVRHDGVYEPGPSARAFLFRGDERIVDLGRPRLDQVLARGAQPGDRVCVYELTAARLGCTTASASNELLPLRDRPDWRPEVSIAPVTSTTLAISVTNVSADLPLKARLFPVSDLKPVTITLTQVLATEPATYTGVFTLTDPAPEGYVRIWVDAGPSEIREVVTDYAVGGAPGYRRGNGGYRRGNGAPTASSDGQVILFGKDLNLGEGQFFVLQAATAPPPAPPWATMIGQAYHLTASASATSALTRTSISFSYLRSEVLDSEQDGLFVYRLEESDPAGCPRGQLPCWVRLDTQRDPASNTASALIRGPGLYAVMASVAVKLDHAGWNLFAYPVHDTRPISETPLISETLRSIDGRYTTVYGYDGNDPADPWRVYDVGAPYWVNDLDRLEYGHGYWINVDRPVTLLLKRGVGANGPARQKILASVPTPPATYYGQLQGGDGLTPTAGMTLTAAIGGRRCGQGPTLEIEGQVVYTVHVLADDGGAAAGCGAAGRTISFTIEGRALAPTAMWDNSQVWRLDLAAASDLNRCFVYLPLARR